MTSLTDAPLKAPTDRPPAGPDAGSRDPADDQASAPRPRRRRSIRDLDRTDLKHLVVGVKDAIREERMSLIAAGVGFFGLVALVPAVIAVVSVYALVSDPADIARQVEATAAAVPDEVRSVIVTQLESIASSPTSGLGAGIVVGLGAALWAASSGMQHLMEALNVAYGRTEERGLLAKRATAVALTIGAALFVATAVAMIAVLPALIDGDVFGPAAGPIVRWARWPILAGAVIAGLAVVYRFAPCRRGDRIDWVTPGAVLATSLILGGSLVFSWYTANLGTYNETYGSLGTAVIVMLWLYVLALSVLVGAEVNSELERRTDE